MDESFLSALRSRIEWKSWYRAALASLAAASLVFGSFSTWAIAFSFLAYLLAFFWERKPHERGLSISFCFLALILALGGFVIGRETDFFEYLGLLQLLTFVVVFVLFFFIFSASASSKKFPIAEASVHMSLFLLWTLLSGMFLDRFGAWWFFAFFLGIAFLSSEIIERSLGERTLRTRSYAAFSGLLAAELLFMLRFLPLHLIPQAILVSVVLVIFFDVVRAGMKGTLSRAFALEKVATLAFFVLFLAFFSRWTL